MNALTLVNFRIFCHATCATFQSSHPSQKNTVAHILDTHHRNLHPEKQKCLCPGLQPQTKKGKKQQMACFLPFVKQPFQGGTKTNIGHAQSFRCWLAPQTPEGFASHHWPLRQVTPQWFLSQVCRCQVGWPATGRPAAPSLPRSSKARRARPSCTTDPQVRD